jgi:hypothetical protein
VATAGEDGVAATIFKGGFFKIQLCFICRILESTVSEEARIEPKGLLHGISRIFIEQEKR